MRRLLLCLLFLTAAFADDKGLAGKYAGEWKSASSGTGGAIRFTLEGPEAETWKCELSFGLEGADVPTTMRAVKVAGSNIDLTYDFDVQGATLRSHVTGQWSGASFTGKYETTVVGGPSVDGGTWTAARDKK